MQVRQFGFQALVINRGARDVARAARACTGRLNGLVLDLRSNPGGSLDEAVALSDLFLTKGRIVSQRGRARGESVTYDAETVFRGDIAEGLPMVVLIDAGSSMDRSDFRHPPLFQLGLFADY